MRHRTRKLRNRQRLKNQFREHFGLENLEVRVAPGAFLAGTLPGVAAGTELASKSLQDEEDRGLGGSHGTVPARRIVFSESLNSLRNPVFDPLSPTQHSIENTKTRMNADESFDLRAFEPIDVMRQQDPYSAQLDLVPQFAGAELDEPTNEQDAESQSKGVSLNMRHRPSAFTGGGGGGVAGVSQRPPSLFLASRPTSDRSRNDSGADSFNEPIVPDADQPLSHSIDTVDPAVTDAIQSLPTPRAPAGVSSETAAPDATRDTVRLGFRDGFWQLASQCVRRRG